MTKKMHSSNSSLYVKKKVRDESKCKDIVCTVCRNEDILFAVRTFLLWAYEFVGG